MRPVTLCLNGIKDPVVLAALTEIQRASYDTLQNDTSSSGAAMATLIGAAADQIAYFTSQFTTAFTSITSFGRTLIGLTGPTIPVAQGGTGDSGTAWTAYTPTVISGSGAFTTVSATGRFKQIGKSVFVEISITDTTNGTAASFVNATLPVQVLATNQYTLPGIISSGLSCIGNIVTTGSGAVNIFKYDGTYPLGTGVSLWVTGVYEAA